MELRKHKLVEKSYFITENSLEYKVVDSSKYDKNYYDNILKIRDLERGYFTEVILEDSLYEELVNSTNSKMGDIIIYNHSQSVSYDDGNRKTVQSKIFKESIPSLNFCQLRKSLEEEEKCKKLQVSLVDKIEFLKYLPYEFDSSLVFVSRTMTEEEEILHSENGYQVLTLLSSDYKKLYEELEKKYDNSSSVSISSPKISLEQEKNSMLAIKILLYGFITLVSLTGITSVFNTIHTSIHLRRKEFAMLRSIGLSPKGFNRMIFFESLFFGLKSLFYSLPVSFFFVLIINQTIGNVFYFGKIIVPWGAVLFSIIGVFLIVLLTMWYSVRKIRKENILKSLRDENI